MPRKGKVLIGPSAAGHPAVDHLRLIETLGSEVVHEVVGVVGWRMTGAALGFAEEQLLPTPLGLGGLVEYPAGPRR